MDFIHYWSTSRGTTTHLWHNEYDSFQTFGVHTRAAGLKDGIWDQKIKIKSPLSSNGDGDQSWSGGAVLGWNELG